MLKTSPRMSCLWLRFPGMTELSWLLSSFNQQADNLSQLLGSITFLKRGKLCLYVKSDYQLNKPLATQILVFWDVKAAAASSSCNWVDLLWPTRCPARQPCRCFWTRPFCVEISIQASKAEQDFLSYKWPLVLRLQASLVTLTKSLGEVAAQAEASLAALQVLQELLCFFYFLILQISKTASNFGMRPFLICFGWHRSS